WVGDEGFDLLEEIELIRLTSRQDRRIDLGLVEAHAGLFAKLDPPQPFDVHVAFPPRQEQSHRIPVPGHERLAVLIERDHGIVEGALLSGTLRLKCEASAPSAISHFALASTPVSSSKVASLTPVHSAHETRPCSACTFA